MSAKAVRIGLGVGVGVGADPPRLAPARGPRCVGVVLMLLLALGLLALGAALASLRAPCPGELDAATDEPR